MFNQFRCLCDGNWGGKTCTLYDNVDDCATSPCKNGATCNDAYEGVTCECASGYGGKRCHINQKTATARPSPDFVPGLLHDSLIVLRQALVSYQDYCMLLLTLACAGPLQDERSTRSALPERSHLHSQVDPRRVHGQY